MKWYKVELEDDNFELLLAENDNDALTQAFNIEEENNDTVFGLYEINDEYENIRTILLYATLAGVTACRRICAIFPNGGALLVCGIWTEKKR